MRRALAGLTAGVVAAGAVLLVASLPSTADVNSQLAAAQDMKAVCQASLTGAPAPSASQQAWAEDCIADMDRAIAALSPSPTPTTASPSPTVSPTPSPTPTEPSPTPTPSPTVTPPAGLVARVVGGYTTANPARLVNAAGTQLQLRGVNRSGTQYVCQDGDGFFDGPSDQASVDAMKTWKMNAVRINGNEACALGTTSYSANPVPAAYRGAAYIAALKGYIAKLHAAGMYVILDLHHHAPANRVTSDGYPLADRDHSPAYWTLMANEFKNDPAVIFDLHNEPWPGNGADTTAAWTCIRDGGSGAVGSGSPCAGLVQNLSGGQISPTYTVAGMQEMLNAVRATGATNVVMVGGPNWAGYLNRWSEFKPVDPRNQLAASVHVYGSSIGSPYASPASWTGDIANLALATPVIAGEGMDGNCTANLSNQWFPFANSRGISYTFWAWIPGNCSNEPSLITNYNGTPTTYGAGLRNHLQATG